MGVREVESGVLAGVAQVAAVGAAVGAVAEVEAVAAVLILVAATQQRAVIITTAAVSLGNLIYFSLRNFAGYYRLRLVQLFSECPFVVWWNTSYYLLIMFSVEPTVKVRPALEIIPWSLLW